VGARERYTFIYMRISNGGRWRAPASVFGSSSPTSKMSSRPPQTWSSPCCIAVPTTSRWLTSCVTVSTEQRTIMGHIGWGGPSTGPTLLFLQQWCLPVGVSRCGQAAVVGRGCSVFRRGELIIINGV